MSYNPYQSPNPRYAQTLAPAVVANADSQARLQFIRRTYLHLGLAILVLMAIEFVIFRVVDRATLDSVVQMLFVGWTPLLFFGAFIAVSYGADSWARTSTNRGMQYFALFVYILAQAIFLVPLLWQAQTFFPNQHLIEAAALYTGMIFTGLTAGVFITRVDFSFLRMFLVIGSFAAFGVILASFMFGGLTGGVVFPGLMILLASGYVLYDTSRIMKHYHTSQYVAASLALFASVVLLFWYVLRLLMALRR